MLSYLLASRRNLEASAWNNEWKVRGAICGAGASEMDMLILTSDEPIFGAELIGGSPWEKSRDVMVGIRHGRDMKVVDNASALRRLRKHRDGKKIPPVLILHGMEDKRVPLSQAVAFHRACKALGADVEMALYPREAHLVNERAHLIDMLERVEKFCVKHLRDC